MKNIGVKLGKYVLILLLAITNYGCFSYYKTYQKKTCEQLGDDPVENIRIFMADVGMKEKYFKVTDDYFSYKKKVFRYDNIKKSYIGTKWYLIGKKGYFVYLISKDGKAVSFKTKNFDIALNAYSSFECLAGITKGLPEEYEKIKLLQELLNNGTITKEEFEKGKAKILNENK